MALPDIFSPTEPQATEAVASGPAKIQANWQALADFLGIPVAPTQLTGAAFAMTSGGQVAIAQAGASVVSDPTTALGIATKQYVDNKALGLPSGTATGTNTYTVALTPAPTNLSALVNVPLAVAFPNANTGAATLNPNTLGNVAIVKNNAQPLAGGDIPGSSTLLLVYDGSNFNLIGPTDATSIQGHAVSATTPLANQVLAYNGTIWVPGSAQSINSFNTVTIASITVTSTITATGNLALTMPATGGPWRPIVQYSLFYHGSGGNHASSWVNDGTNSFGSMTSGSSTNIGATAGANVLAATVVTPVTYANNTSVTFTLNVKCDSGNITAGDTCLGSGQASVLNVSIVAGN